MNLQDYDSLKDSLKDVLASNRDVCAVIDWLSDVLEQHIVEWDGQLFDPSLRWLVESLQRRDG